ncbi:DUF1206 domain-containing protein [Mycolicibacterium litorale]|uniref:Membrane protein n=1 Tax=Mycolicibacterium litorale TaxID=758802 RepID=A0AAD1INK1_9MYCO|nr:DUF1206 domain-containing protein [Mycolicibacterium litorale]MCV7417147.1 DUF1206 domain-containing protein [Mycolicibacterium litorale]TDY04935.1 uncharacterized protein DUF1206 [Mycolicibacterium litorale]BBY18364.1 membrane protein [Mycolicibacterium litorale]
MTDETGAAGAVRTATDNRAAQIAARTGYLINGVLHLLIAYIIFRVAIGSGHGDADQSGALATLAETKGGFLALWGVAVALVPLTLWRLAETVLGLHPSEHHEAHRDPDDFLVVNRLKALGLAVVYAAVAAMAVQFALGSRHSSAERSVGLSIWLMRSPEGKALLAVIGLGVTALGCYYAFKGASRRFRDDLTISGGRLLTVLGVCGHVAEGLVLAGAGVLVVVASIRADPSKATGLDGAVKALGQAPFGSVLIGIAAAGFAAYGMYSFALTRYARM